MNPPSYEARSEVCGLKQKGRMVKQLMRPHLPHGYCQLNMLQAKGNGFTERCHHPSCTHRFLPNLKGLGAQQSIMDRPHQMAAKAKEILREPMQCQKSLRLSR